MAVTHPKTDVPTTQYHICIPFCSVDAKGHKMEGNSQRASTTVTTNHGETVKFSAIARA